MKSDQQPVAPAPKIVLHPDPVFPTFRPPEHAFFGPLHPLDTIRRGLRREMAAVFAMGFLPTNYHPSGEPVSYIKGDRLLWKLPIRPDVRIVEDVKLSQWRTQLLRFADELDDQGLDRIEKGEVDEPNIVQGQSIAYRCLTDVPLVSGASTSALARLKRRMREGTTQRGYGNSKHALGFSIEVDVGRLERAIQKAWFARYRPQPDGRQEPLSLVGGTGSCPDRTIITVQGVPVRAHEMETLR